MTVLRVSVTYECKHSGIFFIILAMESTIKSVTSAGMSNSLRNEGWRSEVQLPPLLIRILATSYPPSCSKA